MVPRDVLINFIQVVAVIAQRIKYLRQREVGKVLRNSLGWQALAPHLDNGANRGASASNNRLAAEDLVVGHNIEMRGCLYHRGMLSLRLGRGYRLPAGILSHSPL